jgi:hypothetical protein
MLVAENKASLSWVSVSDRLPFDGHECALICRDLNSSDLRRAIGCRLHGNWEIEDCALVKCVVLAWLKLLQLLPISKRMFFRNCMQMAAQVLLVTRC